MFNSKKIKELEERVDELSDDLEQEVGFTGDLSIDVYRNSSDIGNIITVIMGMSKFLKITPKQHAQFTFETATSDNYIEKVCKELLKLKEAKVKQSAKKKTKKKK